MFPIVCGYRVSNPPAAIMRGPMNDTHPTANDPAGSSLHGLRAQLETVCSRDFGRLLGRWRALSRRPDENKLASLRADIERSAAKRRARAAARPPIRLDESVPITARGEDI